MSSIDVSSCVNAVNTIKDYVSNCFNKCSTKGSTFSGTQKLSNLESAINLIPSGSGGAVSENITAGNLTPFAVSWAEMTEIDGDYVMPNEFTINFGSVGVTWKSVICFSDTNEGHFCIHKMPNNKCIISSAVFYDGSSEWEEAYGIFPDTRGTYRASYTISGNSITFTSDEYENASNGVSNVPNDFRGLPTQVSDSINDYYINQYKLNKITVVV